VIIGGPAGIGLAIAAERQDIGAITAVVGRNRQKHEQAKAGLQQQSGRNVYFYYWDVTKWVRPQEAMTRLEAVWALLTSL
jgi:NAD(P)-dependent dehydrogenase (short-subunit alcohol dehydrogenase family)